MYLVHIGMYCLPARNTSIRGKFYRCLTGYTNIITHFDYCYLVAYSSYISFLKDEGKISFYETSVNFYQTTPHFRIWYTLYSSCPDKFKSQ
jgi:hypothetical protein